jgi:hypothetical protein
VRAYDLSCLSLCRRRGATISDRSPEPSLLSWLTKNQRGDSSGALFLVLARKKVQHVVS